MRQREMMLIALLAALLYGCETGPSGRWVQPGKTDQEAQGDYAHCQNVAMQESEGQRSTDPFKESGVKEDCMKRMGYSYVKDQPKQSYSRY